MSEHDQERMLCEECGKNEAVCTVAKLQIAKHSSPSVQPAFDYRIFFSQRRLADTGPAFIRRQSAGTAGNKSPRVRVTVA